MAILIPSLTWTYATVLYLSLTTILSLLASIIRLQSYNAVKTQNPEITFSEIVVPVLQLVPNRALFYPWTLLTETFVETSVLKFLIAVTVFYFGINYLEKHWNLNNENKIFSETVYYITIVTVATNGSTVLLEMLFHVLSFQSAKLTEPVNHGVYSLMMSFVVVLKQLSPEHNLKIFNTVSIRLRQLPFILLCTAVVVSLITRSLVPVVPIFNNFYVSWVYLRYYQINTLSDLLPSNNTRSMVRGDASDTFAFIQFFPAGLHKVLRPLCRACYHTSALVGIIRPFNDDDIESGNLRTIKRLNTQTTTVTREIADRRRQVALQVLGERVNANPSGTSQRA
ncbi:hypothetical protein KL921_001122 [Ogataea angusta]|uniref:Uncharacterized protein n=1 Tax=Pichia angusta TaxID=870730 RepID=A0ABQ7S373_PICAN|nr:hypothetical protein KL921_001122 [Ogataea angusta]KAG7826093.1 hypothetical protein KL909_000145 [Ogataea angusta]KAG7832160.1 hypothetical protein KL920_000495 [Ogataea angusta]KAG7836333.1 hypothetical protein KL943_001982 [Ogataea angusta]KAG7843398.1 hypothetical protein KL942_000494 [Ogataea angusta]